MANLFTGIVNTLKFAFENPLWFLFILIGIILMPLQVFDFLLFIIVNLFVILLNVIYWLLVFFVNVIIIGINLGFQLLFSVLSGIFGSITAPQLPLFVFEQQPYMTVDLFQDDTNILFIILSLFGI